MVDGHGGDWCALYLQNQMVPHMIKSLKKEIEMYEDGITTVQMSKVIKTAAYRMVKWLDKGFFDRVKEMFS